ncbi:MAG: glycosyltransferase family 2 protein [Candidatus Sumerlaeia bacterium]|nr:glycosyltransferase family 2 protein [Candidatus Sumerlaeia bacterium]
MKQEGTPSDVVTVVLPAYNEAETIALTIRNLRRLYPDYEVLVVDDGSGDDTAQIAEREGARVIRNRINRGYGAALKQGMRKAAGDLIVFMDADGQHDPADVARLVEALKDCDMVIGARSPEDQVAIRKPGKWLLSVAAEFLAGQHIPDINSGFRAFRRKEALRFLPFLPNGFSLTTTLTLAMLKDGCIVDYVPIRVAPRAGGKSRVRYVKDGIRTLLLISRIAMLFNPLKIFVPVSAFLLGIGLFYTAYTAVTSTNISDSSILLLLSGLGTLLFGFLADQISNLRRGG